MIGRPRGAGGRAVLGGLGYAVAHQSVLLVTGILAARLLGPIDRGHLALIWTITLVVTQFGTLGLPLAVTYEIACGRATARSLLRDLGASVRSQIALLSALYALLIVALVTTTTTPAVAAGISIAVIPALLVQSYAGAALQGTQQFRQYNLLRLAPLAVYAIALVVLAALGSVDLTTATAAWVASWLVSGVATVLLARPVFREDASKDSSVAPASPAALRRFGLRGVLGWASPTETLRVDQLVVGLVLSAYDLGLYVAALAFTNLPRFLVQAVGNVAYPRVAAERNVEAQRRQVWRYVAFGSAVSTVVAGLIAVAAVPLVRLAFGEAFIGAVGPLRVLLFATVILCARRVLSEAMRGAGLAGATSRAEAASWLSLVPTLPLLGLAYGLIGVAVALCIAYLLSLGMLLWAMVGSRILPWGRPRHGASFKSAGPPS